MQSILAGIVAVLLLIPSVCRADDKAEWKKLLGNWKWTSKKENGRELKVPMKGSLKIEKDKFTLSYERIVLVKAQGDDQKIIQKIGSPGRVKIDFSKSPTQIDFFETGDKVGDFLKSDK